MSFFARKFIFMILLPIFLVSAQATLLVAKDCPERFVGKVKKISDSVAPFSSAKVAVDFEVESATSEEFGREKQLNVLKYGPHRFYVGNRYAVGLRGKWICSIEAL